MQPFVSVIVPVYNVEPFFERCLRSLFGQTLDNLEYIVINDCTPDNSMLFLERVLDEYPHRRQQVRIIHMGTNMGLGAVRKVGMKAARGAYVISCDSDDWTEMDMYEKMYAKAVGEDADIVCCGFYYEYGKRQSIEVYEKVAGREHRGGDFGTDIRWDDLHCGVWNKLVRRSLYIDGGIYPYDGVNMWEDWGVTPRLCFLSKKTVILQELLYHYNKQNTSSLTAGKSPRYLALAREQIECTRKLEVFFREHKAFEQYNLSIQKLKFYSKIALLYNGHYQEWSQIFPETHALLWKFPTAPLCKWVLCRRKEGTEPLPRRGIPISRKICYSLAVHGIFLPYDLRCLARRLFNLIRAARVV
jgi:glycosyltransferase involved in cell wall biosynthesis